MSDLPDDQLTMAFPCLKSAGGPYDDESFTAGVTLQRIWHTLQDEQPDEVTMIVRSGLVEQLDLVAMKVGYAVTRGHTSEAWTSMTFTRSTSVF